MWIGWKREQQQIMISSFQFCACSECSEEGNSIFVFFFRSFIPLLFPSCIAVRLDSGFSYWTNTSVLRGQLGISSVPVASWPSLPRGSSPTLVRCCLTTVRFLSLGRWKKGANDRTGPPSDVLIPPVSFGPSINGLLWF